MLKACAMQLPDSASDRDDQFALSGSAATFAENLVDDLIERNMANKLGSQKHGINILTCFLFREKQWGRDWNAMLREAKQVLVLAVKGGNPAPGMKPSLAHEIVLALEKCIGWTVRVDHLQRNTADATPSLAVLVGWFKPLASVVPERVKIQFS